MQNKRIVICCDGTWNSPEEKYVTNVVKMARAVRTADKSGMHQVVFYDWGVGTLNEQDKIRGGAFGEGVDKNIQDAYRFLVHNYRQGDEIFVFGFSRGAYTVRSLCGLIRNSGVLKKEHADKILPSFNMYRSRIGPDDDQAKIFRRKWSVASKTKIKFMGVWDTVGSLGIPLGIFGKHNERKYGFHDTQISSIIENAYHALAVDEKRESFKPTIWRIKPKRMNTQQMWFAGVHSDIGGGYKEAGLSNHTLKWMAGKAGECGLAINKTYLSKVFTENNREILHNSYTGFYKLMGMETRTIGQYPDENVHPTTIRRYRSNPRYRPKNLRDFLEK